MAEFKERPFPWKEGPCCEMTRFDVKMERLDDDLSAFEQGVAELNRDLEALADEARELSTGNSTER